MSNKSKSPPTSLPPMANATRSLLDKASKLDLSSKLILDTGATAIFIMEGIPVNNKRIATKPLSINLPDGAKVQSTHCCDIAIPGLPTVLTGHIVPSLTIASLIGIRVLCDAGCTVNFSKNHCDIMYNNKCIMMGFKDKATDLWTLPIQAIQQQPSHLHRKQRVQSQATHEPATAHSASFAHSIRQRALKVRFAHQALCNPKISKLLKATRKGFLKGCP